MMAAAQLLPIVPLLLLPFAIVFFVVVFPVWAVAVALLWIAMMTVRTMNNALRGQLASVDASVTKAFRWVLTFGGIARLVEKKK